MPGPAEMQIHDPLLGVDVERLEREMEKICRFAVKVIIDRAEHINKKKIVDALEKAITNLRSKDVTLVEAKVLN